MLDDKRRSKKLLIRFKRLRKSASPRLHPVHKKEEKVSLKEWNKMHLQESLEMYSLSNGQSVRECVSKSSINNETKILENIRLMEPITKLFI